MIWNAGTVMPKNLNRRLPARRKTASTATVEIPATSATAARALRPRVAVSAMNEGTTASGFTMVISAVNERRATFQSGMLGGQIFDPLWAPPIVETSVSLISTLGGTHRGSKI